MRPVSCCRLATSSILLMLACVLVAPAHGQDQVRDVAIQIALSLAQNRMVFAPRITRVTAPVLKIGSPEASTSKIEPWGI